MLNPAFLIVWNDVEPGVEAEYRRWHRVEHMPERLAIPGFMLGRRYSNLDGAKYRYLTIYEVASADVFRSEPYRASLAQPTPWTTRMSAQMTNFVRRVCRTVASDGTSIGGVLATFQLQLDEHDTNKSKRLVSSIAAMDGVTGVHLGAVDADATGARRDEMQSRSQPDTVPFNSVLVVESDSRQALAALLPALDGQIAQFTGGGAVSARTYDLALLFQPTHGQT